MINITDNLTAMTATEPAVNIYLLQYSPGEIIALFIMTWICAIVVHELAHFYALRQHSKNAAIYYTHQKGFPAKLATGTEEEYKGISPSNRAFIYIIGVLAGAGFIFLVAAVAYAWVAFLFIPYLLSCRKDIDNFKAARKEMNANG